MDTSPAPTHLGTMLQYLQGLQSFTDSPLTGRDLQSSTCNNQLRVLRRIIPYSKLCSRKGKGQTGKRSRRCSGHHALGIDSRASGTEFQETGMLLLSPKGNRAQGDSGLLRAGLQSGSGVCLNTEKKAEKERAGSLTVLYCSIW